MSAAIPVVVVGATGYVGAELLRLVHQHPRFALLAAVSRAGGRQALRSEFPHLASAFPTEEFVSPDAALDLARERASLAVFSAAPHGASASMIEPYLRHADDAGTDLHVVDASADFRYSTPSAFESVYGTAHGAPHRFSEFAAGVPEQLRRTEARHVGNPGCFASAMLLAAVPLLKAGLVTTDLFATGITGSTGSGKSPIATTHHPLRHANLYSYKALAHRHVPEVEELATRASGIDARLRFVPHSGPFARGIHMTLQGALARSARTDDVLAAFDDYYADCEFVQVVRNPPRIKDVAGSNYAQISAVSDSETVAVFCVIDNLLKGAAGSAMQWMNRLFGLPESAGLTAAAPGWI